MRIGQKKQFIFKLAFVFIGLSFSYGQSINQLQEEENKLKGWNSVRPDLLYEYNKINGSESLAFGLMYHSNVKVDLSSIERCPPMKNSQAVKNCQSLPIDMEQHIRYERRNMLKEDEEQTKFNVDCRINDGESYSQYVVVDKTEEKIIKDVQFQSEPDPLIINIKTLKNANNWNSFVNVQKGESGEEHLLDHSVYFYFACTLKDCLTVESIKNEEKKLDQDNNSPVNNQLLLKIKDSMKEKNRLFKVSNLKGLEQNSLEIRVCNQQQVDIRKPGRNGNFRRILQQDLLDYVPLNDINNLNSSFTGNVIFIRAKLSSHKAIFRVEFTEQTNRSLTTSELVSNMKSAELKFHQRLARIVLNQYVTVPDSILMIASYALSNILGKIFYIETETNFSNDTKISKRIIGIASNSRYYDGGITPSLYEDGFTLKLLSKWNPRLTGLILQSYAKYTNQQGLSVIDQQNILISLQIPENSNLKSYSQSAPSIMLALSTLFSSQNTNSMATPLKQPDSLQNIAYQFAQDTLFNLLFQKTSTKQENLNLKWILDETCNCYKSSGLEDLQRSEEELVTSVDYLSWSILAASSMIKMSKTFPVEFQNDIGQYQQIKENLERILINELQEGQEQMSERVFKEKIKLKTENRRNMVIENEEDNFARDNEIEFSNAEIGLLNMYPFLLDGYELKLSKQNQQTEYQQNSISNDHNLNFIINHLLTEYGVAGMTQKNGKHTNNTNTQSHQQEKYSQHVCYRDGDISLVQNYLVLRRLHELSQFSQLAQSTYSKIYTDLLDNILKQYFKSNQIYEIYDKQNGSLKSSCKQTPAQAVFLLLLNEDYQ